MLDSSSIQRESVQAKRAEERAEDKKNDAAFEKLVRKAVRGNKDALYSLCQEIALRVLFRARYILRDRADAEDAAQEVLVRLCEKIQELEKPEAFHGWLNSIILNETRRIMSKKLKQNAVLNISDYLDALEDDEELQPLEHTIREEDRKVMAEIINRLPERQRQAMVLHYYEGFSVTQTAEIMEISHSNVSGYLKLARDKVKKELENNEAHVETISSGSKTATGGKTATGDRISARRKTPTTSKTALERTTSSGLALLPVDPLLAQVAQQEAQAAHKTQAVYGSYEALQATPANDVWFKQTMKSCLAVIDSKVGAGAFGASIRIVGGVAAALLIGVVVFVGMWFGGLFPQPENQTPFEITEGAIVFIGGDTSREHVNPTRATAQAIGEYGRLTVYFWEITAVGSESVLFSGTESIVEDALILMQTEGMNGDYVLRFNMKDEAGNSGWLHRNFTIQVSRD